MSLIILVKPPNTLTKIHTAEDELFRVDKLKDGRRAKDGRRERLKQ
jgi:hypothetical protein